MKNLLTTLILLMFLVVGCQHDNDLPVDLSENDAPTTIPKLKKDTSTPNKCPDISGIYYDRAIDQFDDKTLDFTQGIYAKSDHSHDDATCEFASYDYNRWMSSRCSLRHWFNNSLRRLMFSNQKNRTPSCPSINKIEFVTADNYESIQVITYRESIVESTYTIGFKASGFNCMDGKITFEEQGRPVKIFLSKDGSLNIKDGEGGMVLVPGFMLNLPTYYPIPVPTGTSENFYKWIRVDKTISPYKNCHELFDDTYKEVNVSDEDLSKELTRINDAFHSKHMSLVSYRRLLDYLRKDYGNEKVQKAFSDLGIKIDKQLLPHLGLTNSNE